MNANVYGDAQDADAGKAGDERTHREKKKKK